MSVFDKLIGKKKEALDVDESCIPDFLPPSSLGVSTTTSPNTTSSKEYVFLKKKLFYMFYQIKVSEMDQALVHLDPEFAEWWKKYWDAYEKKLDQKALMTRVSKALTNEFSQKELDQLTDIDSFDINIETDNSGGSMSIAGKSGL